MVRESAHEQAMRRSAERRAQWTPADHALAAEAKRLAPLLLARLFVGPGDAKGRQDGWVMPEAEWVALGAPRTAAEWAATGV